MRKRWIGLTLAVLLLCMAVPVSHAETAEDNGGNFVLKQVVVLSRHNIRAPLAGPGSVLDSVTPYEWIRFSAKTSELTVRGGTMEIIMGAWFRKWLDAEGLIPENSIPAEGAVRFYANALQRTIATARSFAAGFLPVANVAVETHAEYNTMDPTFLPCFHFVSEAYREAAEEEIAQIYGVEDVSRIGQGLEDAYALLAEVIGLQDSTAYAEGTLQGFDTEDTVIRMELGAEPGMTGSLKLGCQIADALVLQYYEEQDDLKAGFGKALSESDMRLISSIKDRYVDSLFAVPIVAVNLANPLLKEIAGELNTENRAFTFLCGHDSNLASVLAALDCKREETVGSIEPSIPIGSKILFEKWADQDDALYVRIRLLYPSAAQLRSLALLDDENPPVSLILEFNDLPADENGFYPFEELMARFEKAFDAYDSLPEIYGDELENAA